MSLGSLRVLLGLDAAEFTSGLKNAELQAQKFQRNMGALGTKVGAALGVGLTTAVTALVYLTKRSIDAADHLNDLSKSTNISVENLGGLGFAASQAGSDLDGVAQSFGKLNLKIAEAARGEKEASAAFKALGISVKDASGETKAADVIFGAIATKFEQYADGPEKAALGNALFGKSYQSILPLLSDGGKALQENIEFYKRFGGVTTETARAADQFNDTLGKLSLISGQFGRVLASELLRPLQFIASEFLNTAENANLLTRAAKEVADAFVFMAERIAIASNNVRIGAILLGGLKDSVRGLQELDIKGLDAISGAVQRDILAATKSLDKFTKDLKTSALAPVKGIGLEDLDAALNRPALGVKPPAPRLPTRGGTGADKAAQEAKKLLDKQLSDIDNFIKAEKRIFETRESDLARLYQNDQISIAAYFDERLAALDRNTTATVALYDKQIKAQEAFAAAAKRRKDEPAAIDAQKQIGDIQSKIEDVLHEKQQRALKIEDERKQSARDYADQVAELQARLLDLLGTEEAAGKAALIRFDIQNRALLNRARTEGDRGTEQAISQLRTQADSQAKINVLLQDAAVIEQNLATAQAKLHLERDLGLRGELESLDLLGKSSGEAAAQLQIIADKYLAIAQADGSKVLIANAEAFKQKINELAASADVLAIKIRQTFVDTGASAIETFLNSIADGKNVLDSFKAAFTQFANDIIRQINRIAAEEIANSLFKKGGSGGDSGIFGGIVNAIVNAISGREKGGSVSGKTPYVVGERGPEIFVPQTVAAAATKQIDSIIAQRGKPAEYTDRVKAATVATNLPHLIGTKGPEIFVPKAAGIIIPNDKVAKIARALERKVASPIARRREISVAARTILRDEKIITRYANAPYSRRASGGPVAAHVPYIVGERGREIFIPKSANTAVQRDEAISKLSTAFQKQGRGTSASVASRWSAASAAIPSLWSGGSATKTLRIISERQVYIQQSARAIQQSRRAVAELVANAPRQRRAGGGPVAARTPYVVGELGPELFMPKSASRIIKNEKAIDDLVSNKIQHRAISGPNVTYILGERGHEIFISKLASTNIKNEKFISDLVSNTVQHRASVKNEMLQNDLVSNTRNEKTINQFVSNIQRGPFAAHQTYLIDEREIVPKSARRIINNKKAVDDIVSSVQPRAVGGPVAAQKFASKIIKNEKVIYDLVTNTIQHKAQGGPIDARQTYIVGERGPELFVTKSAEKIIKNENRVSELVTNNARRNEKVINDLVSKTVHHREIAGSVAAKQSSIQFSLPRSGKGHSSPDVAAKIIKNESRISELVSNDVQRNEEIINRLITTTRREGGRSNELLIVGAHGPELFIPKAAGRIIKNERRINELVSNIEHRSIDRHSEKTIDEIIASTVQRRAQRGPVGTYQKYRERVAEVPKRIIKNEALRDKAVKRKERVIADIGPNIQRRAGGGPVSAYQQYLVGERGPEIYMPRDKDKVGGIKVPADFFTNKQHHRVLGGAVAANQPYLVGERGAEAFVPKAAGRIVRNDDIGRQGGSTVEQTINFILPNQITSQTQNQIASRTLFAARRAVARGVA